MKKYLLIAKGLKRVACLGVLLAGSAWSGAEALATQVVSEAIATSGTQALNYFVAQKYTEAVAAFANSPNAKTILFPVEATQLIGSIGGIGALVRDALGDSSGAKK